MSPYADDIDQLMVETQRGGVSPEENQRQMAEFGALLEKNKQWFEELVKDSSSEAQSPFWINQHEISYILVCSIVALLTSLVIYMLKGSQALKAVDFWACTFPLAMMLGGVFDFRLTFALLTSMAVGRLFAHVVHQYLFQPEGT